MTADSSSDAARMEPELTANSTDGARVEPELKANTTSADSLEMAQPGNSVTAQSSDVVVTSPSSSGMISCNINMLSFAVFFKLIRI